MDTKNIVLGVTGGVAAYKACDYINKIRYVMKDAGLNVNIDVIMTDAATKFITPFMLQTLSKNKVCTDMFENVSVMSPEHISLAQKADVLVILPATANTIAKIVNGIADNLLTSVILATKAPMVVCPAMNDGMYLNKITYDNIYKLDSLGKITKFHGNGGYDFEKQKVVVVQPIIGNLACNTTAIGHLAKMDTIIEATKNILLSN